jgi:type VI secretion system FHA domain protein
MIEISITSYKDIPSVVPRAGVVYDGGTIGIGKDNAVVLLYSTNAISQRHLLFTQEAGGIFRVTNIGDGSSVFVDGLELAASRSCRLRNFANIVIGAYVLSARYLISPTVEFPANVEIGDHPDDHFPASSPDPDAIPLQKPTMNGAGNSDDALTGLVLPLGGIGGEHASVSTGRQPDELPLPVVPVDPLSLFADHGNNKAAPNPPHASQQFGIPTSVAEPWAEKMNPPANGHAFNHEAPVPPAQMSSKDVQPEVRMLYEAFIEGLGEELPRAVFDEEFMKTIGQLLCDCVQGLVEMATARTVTKKILGASITVIEPEGNNPLKFSQDGKAALHYLLEQPPRGFMKPSEAVRSVFTDLHAHQIGVISGTKAALLQLVDCFDPVAITRNERGSDLHNGLLTLPMMRKASLWDAYSKYYQSTRENITDRFQDFIGTAFLEAYEKAVSKIQSGGNHDI